MVASPIWFDIHPLRVKEQELVIPKERRSIEGLCIIFWDIWWFRILGYASLVIILNFFSTMLGVLALILKIECHNYETPN